MANSNIPIKTKKLEDLKIISINVNSIIANHRRDTIAELLKEVKPDILCLNETKLNPNHIISFKNYIVLRNDNTTMSRAGGTAIIINNELKFDHISLPERDKPVTLQNTIVKLYLQDNKFIYLIAAYANDKNAQNFINDLNYIMNSINAKSNQNYVFLIGDLNAKHTNWNNTTINHKGKLLNDWIYEQDSELGLIIKWPRIPTYPAANSTLDIIILDHRIKLRKFKDGHHVLSTPYDSDHNAIRAVIKGFKDTHMILQGKEYHHKLNYKKADWQKFKDYLSKNQNIKLPTERNLTISEIDDFVYLLEENIKKAVQISVPINSTVNNTDKYLNGKINKLKKDKNYLLTLIHRERYCKFRLDLPYLCKLKKMLDIIKKKLIEEFKLSISKYWREKINKISHKESHKMFPEINQIFRKKKPPKIYTLKVDIGGTTIQNSNIPISCLKVDTTKGKYIISDEKHKLDILGDHYENICSQAENLGNVQLTSIVHKKIEDMKHIWDENVQNNLSLSNFSHDNPAHDPTKAEKIKNNFTNITEMKKFIKKLPNKVSSGLDEIPNLVLKNLPVDTIMEYVIIFNNSLNVNYFPKAWKIAKIVAILKKDKINEDPASYRPICLLPCISKLYEIKIDQLILKHCESNKQILTNYQYGFRNKHSTVNAINHLITDAKKALKEKRCMGACLIDLEKAFDTVWIEGLAYKLFKKEIPQTLIQLIMSMITDRTFYTSSSNIMSTKEFSVKNGLQQGTVNSPILFNIFTSDVLRLFGEESQTGSKAIAFADDLIIYNTGLNSKKVNQSLQTTFDKVQTYYDNWKLKINTNKCETILFRRSTTDAKTELIKNYKKFILVDKKKNNQKIPHKVLVKYLGIHLDDRLVMNKHIELQLKKTKNAWFALRKLFYSKYLDYVVKVIAYQSLIRPILTYACQIWFNLTAKKMEEIRIFERKCLRACIGFMRSRDPETKKI